MIRIIQIISYNNIIIELNIGQAEYIHEEAVIAAPLPRNRKVEPSAGSGGRCAHFFALMSSVNQKDVA